MGFMFSSETSFKAAAILLVLGGALATGGCQETSAGPRAEPVDRYESAPPRRGSY